ncbi:aerobic respiration control sensor protein arcB [Stachybotrys elegans]|uniref:Aerobic respiration control sensor protein arcB n=1 Tax=Stachybotrys elegans TaxID=80388 RepID=A0A8K0SSG7_9HYPO|nr:aerobic respiration control sensor protein arcB [Stachybotrys elegans]
MADAPAAAADSHSTPRSSTQTQTQTHDDSFTLPPAASRKRKRASPAPAPLLDTSAPGPLHLRATPLMDVDDPVVELDQLRLPEILDADSRPTFVIDLDPDLGTPSPDGVKLILPVFCNAALRQHERLRDALVGHDAQGLAAPDTQPPAASDPALPPSSQDSTPSYQDYKAWATGVTSHDDSRDVFPQSFVYGDFLWTGSTVRQRWRLISGNRLWRASQSTGDLSSGMPLEVATGGLRAEKKHQEKVVEVAMNPPLTAAAVAAPAPASTGSSKPTESNEASSRVKYTTTISTRNTRSSKRNQETATGSSDETRTSSGTTSIILSAPEKAVADWTAKSPKGVLSEHLRFARSVDWAHTPLGPMKSWSKEFRQVVNLVMNNPHPAALFWGSDLTMIYNEAYAREVAGNKHPSLMGTGFSGPFSELWDMVAPIFAECARTGISVRKEDDYLPIDRHGLLEETFYSWSWTPLYGGTDTILGFYNAPFETTSAVISQRRTETITRIGELTAQSKTVKQFWPAVLAGLMDNHFDVPFALLYSVGDAEDGDHSSVSSGSTMSLKTCHLEGAIGVPEGHIAAPPHLDLKRSREGFVPSFREAMRTREPTLLHTRDATLPEALLDGIDWRGFGDPCREAIIFPVRPTNGDAVLAFLVLGVNPRRPFDSKYKSFISMLNRQLATSLASVILFEDEVRRSRDAAEAAALEREQLTQQLALQDSRLRRMTEASPLGMFLISPEGVLREANDRFYEMTGHNRDSQYEMSWMDFILESSTKTMEEGWRRLTEEHLPWSGELQIKKRSTQPVVNLHGESIDYWVMFIAHSEFSPDGSVRSIMGTITDISHLKWAEGLQNRRLQEAEETRRQQNEFIDITSHEMRNPLSAILQCADDISSALGEYRGASAPTTPQAVIESCVEAANTISLCVQHQKSIVDDILTISKLDSNLLVITPSVAQPDAILRRALKMFDPELQAKGIDVVFEKRPSYTDLAVDWVAIDPSRVLQILINLMTNAIKFTAPASTRVITVAVGASVTRPDDRAVPGFQYVPIKEGTPDVVASSAWGTGELLYITFKVQDTGCGLSSEEKQILFQRFKQASPRTHAQYGGSGLGLFISKHLTELHGGQIGVASESGQGSLFALYVQARRSPPPSSDDASQETLPIERDLGGDNSLARQVTPQRQDFASYFAAAPIAAPIAAPTTLAPIPEPPADAPPTDPKTITILVVEDNLINQKVLVAQLRKVGCSVSAANDGLEALAFLGKTHFQRGPDGDALSIILMDLEMPNMDGLTCVREIRRMEDTGAIAAHVPVIAVTANVRDEQVALAKSSGMDDVVSKPFRIPELMAKIVALLNA